MILKKLVVLFLFITNIYATNILILNSYRVDLGWTNEQFMAIKDTLTKSKIENIQFNIEFMDTKLFRPNEETQENRIDFYSKKYKNTKFDIVITTDDNALNFVRKYKEKDIFKKSKVFFSGVNDLSLYDTLDNETYVGIFERKNPIANFKLAKKIDPNLKTIYLLSDETLTAKKLINEYKYQYKDIDSINFVYINEKDIDIVLKKLKNHEKNSILMLLVIASHFDNDKHISIDKVNKKIVEVYKNPILIHTSVYLDLINVVGGNCVSGTQQGKSVALKVIEFLKNKPMKDIGFMLESLNSYYFNMKNSSKFNIDIDQFGMQNPILINKPVSFYELYYYWINIIIFTIILVILFLIVLLKKNKQLEIKSFQIKEINRTLDKKVKEKTKELQEINSELDKRVAVEIEHNKQKELQLFEQSKMAQMGEMIANIAHQWRQPLSAISIIASGVKLKQEFNTLKIDELPKNMSLIIDKTIYLSDTIDLFRNFLMEEKVLKNIVLQERISVSANILDTVMKDYGIDLQNNISYNNPLNVNIVAGELTEVIINIINNAKDILVEKNIDNPWIKIELKTQSNKAIVTIEDNAGGIPNDIIKKVFNPYFTTKNKNKGTGLGLYMSYKIVKQGFKGDLYVKNSKNGAMFYIELPLV
ncbi:MAG: HAMP domain-containing sensor histidine kinase [Campylobacterota bacterium]|nr:HAMP domain-containing sensor histidine kinase [Campylobacterota bacterium]